MDNLGHIFRVRHPDNPEQWIDIPVMFQTMYQAYAAYCETNGKPIVLTEEAYYTVLGELSGLKASLEEYINVLQDPNAPPISTTKGGTGASVADLKELLEYLGLSSDVNSVGNKFPTTEAIKSYVDTEVEEAKEKASLELQLAFAQLFAKAQNGHLNDLGITSGTDDPGLNTPGTIYIKYSN